VCVCLCPCVCASVRASACVRVCVCVLASLARSLNWNAACACACVCACAHARAALVLGSSRSRAVCGVRRCGATGATFATARARQPCRSCSARRSRVRRAPCVCACVCCVYVVTVVAVPVRATNPVINSGRCPVMIARHPSCAVARRPICRCFALCHPRARHLDASRIDRPHSSDINSQRSTVVVARLRAADRARATRSIPRTAASQASFMGRRGRRHRALELDGARLMSGAFAKLYL
jgi:hypothetical protein